jgi:hypothetical protein
MAGLQVFRNTPKESIGLSPAVIIFGHSIRDSVPMKREALHLSFGSSKSSEISNANKESKGQTKNSHC